MAPDEPISCSRCGKARTIRVETVFHRERRIPMPCGCWAEDNPTQVDVEHDRISVTMRASGCPRYALFPEAAGSVTRTVDLLERGPSILGGGAWSGKTTIGAAALHAMVKKSEGAAAWVSWDALISSDTDVRQIQAWATTPHLALDDVGGQAMFTAKQIDWCSNRLETVLRGRLANWTTLIIEASGCVLAERLNPAAWERVDVMTGGRRYRLTGFYGGR